MKTSSLGMLCVACLLAPPATDAVAAPRATAAANRAPARAAVVDLDRRLDANRMSLVVSNLGWLGFDIIQAAPGLWYPRDAGTTLLFASGLWLGASGMPRVTVAEYSSEYGPGPMSGTGPGSPAALDHRVWKVQRWTGDPQDSAHVDRAPGGASVDDLVHHSWSEYMAGAVPHGAPWKQHRLPETATPDPTDSVDVPGPDVLGDLMLWCVFNDADPSNHTNVAGMSLPLGAEVEQVVFAFADPGPVGDVAFVRWRVRNRGLSGWSGLRAGFWADPDIGGSTDDKVGCDSTRSLGFAYNGQPADAIYGLEPPVLGTVLLGSSPAGAGPGGMHAFSAYMNGTDPIAAEQSYRSLSGLATDGGDVLDPFGNPTRYMFSGNPVSATGWLDGAPSDKRMMASFAPRDLAPGDSLELWAALLVSPGPGLAEALASLPCRTDAARAAFASGFARPFASAQACAEPPNCPRPAAYWQAQCGGGAGYDLSTLATLGTIVNATSEALEFGPDPRAGLCATLAAASDVRETARREFAAFMANVTASAFALQPAGQMPVTLQASTPVDCPGVAAHSIGALATMAATTRVVTGEYRNLVTTHRTPIAGVDFGLSGFGGGAGSMWDFFGSTLDPAVHPDSFPARVLLAFDHTQTQKAYRYLRNELAGGALPAVGRGYRYAGFVDVPFTARDSVTGDPLDVAFVERVVTDDAGVIQPAEVQSPSYDGAWGPTTDGDGGREYLFVSRRPYGGVPRPEFAADGVLQDGSLPWLYGLGARLRSETDVFDDGDAFAFGLEYPFTPGADAVLRELEGQPLTDPAVAARYAQLADCLGAINRGETVGPVCDEPTPALVSLVSADAEPGLVRIEWRLASGGAVTVERREQGGEWQDLAVAAPDGLGRVVIADRDVRGGVTYDYRLRLPSGYAGPVTLQVPAVHRLSLAGFRPNPATGPPAIAFTLASSAPARIDVLDVAGRRLYARAVERPVPGQRVLPLADLRLAPGVYVVRLEQGGERLVARGVVLR